MRPDELPHIVIIGGGFAGLAAARALRRERARVTLLDRRNFHLFFPLLYQVATAGLSPGDISAPIRRVLRRHANTTVLLGEATSIDDAARKVILSDGVISYDYLIVAAGSSPHYFGRDEWATYAPGLLSMEEALEVRRRLLLAFEEAEREEEARRRAERMTFIVIGGGPTGVEMAGAIAEMARHTLAGEFRRIDPREARVILLEGAPRVLPAMPESLSVKARLSLERLGVEVRTGTKVTEVDETGVTTQTGRIASRCVLWAAGVRAAPLARSLGVALDRSGRVDVNPDLSVPGHPRIYVAGDLAAVPREGGSVPGLAPAAIQEGRHAARNVSRAIRGVPALPFRYRDHGTLATIGRAAAVADFGRVKLSGFIAWLAWIFIHIYFLIGFRNRLLVMFEWAWAYVTYDRGVRLVMGSPDDVRRPGVKPGAALLTVLALGASAGSVAAGPEPAPPRDSRSGPTTDEWKLVDLVNAERTARKIKPLRWDPLLARLARAHAADMRQAGKISHHSSADGADFSARLARTAYRARAAAENVAFDRDVQQAHRGLMTSPGHRANILSENLTAIGTAVLEDASGESIYVVEDFATPIVTVSDEEAAERIRKALARARRSAGRGSLEEDAASSRRLQEILEGMIEEDSVEKAPRGGPGPGWTFRYTSMEPELLSAEVERTASKAEGFAVAVSFRKTRSYRFGTYWVVLFLKGSP